MRILFDHGYWALRLIENLRADAPEQRCMKCIESAAADDDQVTSPLFGKVEDRLRRTAGAVMRFIEDCLRDKPLRPFEDLLGFGPDGTCHAFRQPRYFIRIRTAIKIRYMQDVDRSTCRICQNGGKTHGLVGSTRSVNRNQNTSQPFHTMNPSRSISLSWCIIREHMGKFL